MNYQRIYDSLINRAKERVAVGYTEKHHVCPKCLGGTDNSDNLVSLYPEEHFTAHIILVKLYPENKDLILAVNRMTTGHNMKRQRKMYGWLRRRFAERMSENSAGENNSQFGTLWITDGIDNKKIKNNDIIPESWYKGRTLSKRTNSCIDCSTPIKLNSQRCKSCFSVYSSVLQRKITDDELLAIMKDYDMSARGTIAAILKKIGVVPQSPEYYKRIRALVVK